MNMKGSKFLDSNFTLSWEQERKDLEDGQTGENITYREMGVCLNSIFSTLKFALEKHSDFCGNWLPTLDFKVRPDHVNNRLEHTCFEKNMNTKWTIPSI